MQPPTRMFFVATTPRSERQSDPSHTLKILCASCKPESWDNRSQISSGTAALPPVRRYVRSSALFPSLHPPSSLGTSQRARSLWQRTQHQLPRARPPRHSPKGKDIFQPRPNQSRHSPYPRQNLKNASSARVQAPGRGSVQAGN